MRLHGEQGLSGLGFEAWAETKVWQILLCQCLEGKLWANKGGRLKLSLDAQQRARVPERRARDAIIPEA